MFFLRAHGKQAGKIAFREGFWHSGVDNPRAVLRVVHAADTCFIRPWTVQNHPRDRRLRGMTG